MELHPVSSTAAGRWERVGAQLQDYVDRGIFPGFHSLVYRHGQIVHRHLCGFQDIAAKRPVQEDAIYRIYSMTKPITAAALMMLFEEGKFFLDEPIFPYLLEFKEMQVYAGQVAGDIKTVPAERPITFRQLLTHTSGLGYGILQGPVEDLFRQAKIDGLPRDPNQTLAEYIQAISRLPLATQPGTRWSYSLGLDVAGLLVSHLSGLPFEEFLRVRLFEPLGMGDTAFYVPAEKLERLATLYDYKRGKLNGMEFAASSSYARAPTAPSGGAGLVSTAADYLRFCRMLLNKGQLEGVRVLGSKTVELIMANHLAPALQPWFLDPAFPAMGFGYGLGGSVLQDRALAGSLGSVGTYSWGGAANTQMFVDPAEDLTAVLMTQTFGLTSEPLPPINEIWQRLIYQALD